MTTLAKAIKSPIVQFAASVLIVASVWKLLGTLEVCGTVLFLVLLTRAMRRENQRAGGRV